jgi:hypothetical protein
VLLIEAVRRLFAISEQAPAEKEPSAEGGTEAKVTRLATAATGPTGESK